MIRQLLAVSIPAALSLAELPGQCVRFLQPTDTIRLTNNTVLGTSGTIEAWVYLEGPASTGTIFNEWTDNAEDKHLRIGPLLLEGYGLLSQGAVTSTSPLATDQWHHVAYVYGQSQQRLYLDGQRVATLPGVGSFSNGPGHGHLGWTPHPGHVAFRGLLDSFRISSTAQYTGTSFVPPARNLANTPGTTLVLYNFDDPASSPTVADSSGNGNHGTLGFPGATAPTLGVRVMTCQRAPGGQLNQQAVDAGNSTISVSSGAMIQGTVNLRTYNDMQPGAVAPLAGTADWGSRTTQYWSVHPWIATGVNVYPAAVNIIAPTQPGTYYLIFGFSGMYGADQVMSSTHPAIPAVWNDGNDVGFDWTQQQFTMARANGGAVMISMRLPSGAFVSQLEAFTAVRVNVLGLASVNPLGAGCPGTNGTPLLQSTLPILGNTAILSCVNLVPGFAMMVLGSSRTDWNGVPLPLNLSWIGMTGCTLYVRPDVTHFGPTLGGLMVAGLQVPSSTTWIGTEIYAQTLGFDPGLNPFGASLSNALTLTLGL